jgi:hypothetical protein
MKQIDNATSEESSDETEPSSLSDNDELEFCSHCALLSERHKNGRPANDLGCDRSGPTCFEMLEGADADVKIMHCHGEEMSHITFVLSPKQLEKFTENGPWPRVCRFLYLLDGEPEFYETFSSLTCFANQDGTCVATAKYSDDIMSGLCGSVSDDGSVEPSPKKQRKEPTYHLCNKCKD